MSEWISVEDQQPEPGIDVLGVLERGSIATVSYHPGCTCTGKWHGRQGQKVTHWMPLPEAPAEPTPEPAVEEIVK